MGFLLPEEVQIVFFKHKVLIQLKTAIIPIKEWSSSNLEAIRKTWDRRLQLVSPETIKYSKAR